MRVRVRVRGRLRVRVRVEVRVRVKYLQFLCESAIVQRVGCCDFLVTAALQIHVVIANF